VSAPPRDWTARIMACVAVLTAVAVGILVFAGGDDGGRRSGHVPVMAGGAAQAESRPKPARPPPYARRSAPAAKLIRLRFKHPPRAALVWSLSTGRVLLARHPERRLRIASLTKMMTAIVVADRAGPNERVLITRQAVHFQGSGVGMLPRGRQVRLESLLYGLLLPSGNDAAIALAQHVAGTLSGFERLMNRAARRMRLACTHFASVSGFEDRRNYSCAADLAVIAGQLLRRPRLARIVRTRSIALPFPVKGGKLYLYNNNPLLLMRYRGTTGVKTGFTDAAGRCLVVTARRGRTRLGVVLLHSPNPPAQARRLLDLGLAAARR